MSLSVNCLSLNTWWWIFIKCTWAKTGSKPISFMMADAAAKPHQSCPTLCDPIDGSPPGSRPWDSPGKNTRVGCHFLLQCMKVKSESEVARSCPTLCNPMDCSLPGYSIHGISQARVLECGASAFSIQDSSGSQPFCTLATPGELQKYQCLDSTSSDCFTWSGVCSELWDLFKDAQMIAIYTLSLDHCTMDFSIIKKKLVFVKLHNNYFNRCQL